MSKERIIELKIEDDDFVSGVDQISLVDEPAIEYNWLAFNKHSHDFHVPDGEDHKFLEFLKDKGETEEDLKKEGWVLTRANVVGSDQFSDPNGTSVEDTDEVRIRYRYGLAPNISGSPVISTTRDFCKSLVNENRVYRLEDIQSLPSSPQNPGGNAIWYRGGFNCRHFWYQLEYQPEGRIINKASIERGRIPDTPAYGDANLDQRGTVTTKTLNNPKPSTVRNLGLSKEKFTLPLFEREEDAIDYSKLIDCQEGAHPHEIEGVTLWMPCASHPEELGYDVGGLPPYVDECPDCEKKKEEMGELEDACWPGYEAIGTKIKDGREVPNCVPIQNSKSVFSFQEDGDKMIVVGPAMIPNKKILRSDEKGNKYYVYFSEETILQISEKFMKRGYTKDGQHDIQHMGPGEKDVYVAESWIIEDPEHDKSKMYGFSDLPKGTWMVKMRVMNKGIWKLVKEGKLRGFSVSGFFEEYERNANELQFLKELAQLLSK